MENKPTLKILQYNIRKELGTMTALLMDDITPGIDILAIQEPWYNTRNKSSYNPSSSQFYLAHRIGEGTRTCFYVNKDLDSDSWSVEYESDDLCTLRLYTTSGDEEGRARGTSIRIQNVYNPSPVTHRQSGSRPEFSELLNPPNPPNPPIWQPLLPTTSTMRSELVYSTSCCQR